MTSFLQASWQMAFCLVLMWLSALYPLYLPGAALPITLQSLFCILLPLVLSPLGASAGIFLYLLLGALGVPLFAGGTGGASHFLSNSGGYLVGFFVVSVLSGYGRRFLTYPRILKTFLLFILMHTVLTLMGLGWIALSKTSEIRFSSHVDPFLIGLIVKSFAGTLIYESVQRLRVWDTGRSLRQK